MSTKAIRIDRTRFPVDEWALVETAHDQRDAGTTETLFSVGNGYLGMRANPDEGREAHAHGTFINGLHETWPIRHAEEAYGFARVGQTIVNAPDAKTIKLYVDDEPLLLATADLQSYQRRLDMRTGQLVRDLVWRTPSGNRVRVVSRRLVSFPHRHLAQITFEVTVLDRPASIVLSSQLLNRQDGGDDYRVPQDALGQAVDPRKADAFTGRVLQPAHQHAADGRLALGYVVTNSTMTVATMVDHRLDGADARPAHEVEPDIAKAVYSATAQPGQTITLTKTVAYHSSRGVPVRELVDRCSRTLAHAAGRPPHWLREQQRAWLDDFWRRSDVRIEGHPDLQQAVRWSLFQVAQASVRAQDHGIAAKGVSGCGYGGHYFWDTEIYALPFLTYTNPQVAKNALRFRHRMLDFARERAGDLNQVGALFPWRTINGLEASAYYPAGTAQYHIDADVSYALAQYVAATGDTEMLAGEGIDILVETARMFEDLGFWRASPTPTFHIHGVTGPDEYTTVVNDNLYTNVMARLNLRRAADAVTALAVDDPDRYAAAVARLSIAPHEPAAWRAAADAMHLGFDAAAGIHPQDSQFLDREVWDLAATPDDKRPLLLHYHPLVIYRFQVIKQADVVLSMLLAGDQFTAEHKRANFDYYDPITTGDSTLSAAAQSIIAAEVGHHELAYRYFERALFVDLADLHDNTDDGVHVASAGGVWMTLVHGFAGMRDHDGHLSFDPRLPAAWPSLDFTLQVHGHDLTVHVASDHVELARPSGPPVVVTVRGVEHEVVAGAPVRVATVPAASGDLDAAAVG